MNIDFNLESPVSKSFMCTKAANSLDIDSSKKSIHHFQIDADIETDYRIGLIVGASGSGKTTFAKHVWGDDCFDSSLVNDAPVIEQFPDEYSYDERAIALSGVGLTQVPCWIRPVYTLSNGQRARAQIAVDIANSGEFMVIDEWTSVVDRTVAKVMSHCVAKFARRNDKQIVLLSCHYDVLEWLNPDWVIDCNKSEFIDRRLLRQRQRKEKLKFEIRRTNGREWRYFSKYHYLSDRLAGGHSEYFGLFHADQQVGFTAFTNYVPWRNKRKPKKMHLNRIVIHPDYAGFGLGVLFANKTAELMTKKYDVWIKLSSIPLIKSFLKIPDMWRLLNSKVVFNTVVGGNMKRQSGFREKVKVYSFRYIKNPAKRISG